MPQLEKPKLEKNVPVQTEKSSADFLFSRPHDAAENEADFYGSEGQLACDVFQDKENIYAQATMAGVDPKNLDISVSNDLLTVRGFREMNREVEENDFYCREIYWGAFSRSIVLPQEVDQKKVQATLKNGVLTIKLPKKYKTTSIKIRHFND